MTPPPDAARVRQGLLAAVAAFLIWGLLPLYLRPLRAVPPLEVMAHRVLWSCVLVYGWLGARGQLAAPLAALREPRTRRGLITSAALVSVNWLVFVWAVSVGRTVDASLGYFINPLFNVLLGVLVLRERLSPLRWAAVGLASLGVLWLAVAAGEAPWIALVLAFSFGLYGLIRKLIAVEAVVGLAAETSLLAPPAAVYLLWQQLGAAPDRGPGIVAWLLLGGLITAVPLALFAYGARLIPYATVGLIQYLGPSLQFLCGVFVFGEPFAPPRALGFAVIWGAVLLYLSEDVARLAFSRPRSDRDPGTTQR